MAGDLIQHVLQKRYTGIEFGFAGTIEINADGNLGFAGIAGNSGGTHVKLPINGLFIQLVKSNFLSIKISHHFQHAAVLLGGADGETQTLIQ